MTTEERLLATLNFTSKNSFEILNKLNLWATTSEDVVQFNLLDGLPVGSNGTSGRGVFTSPRKIPSFSSIVSNIFGTAGTNESRTLYWNLNFASKKGWSFKNYSGNSALFEVLTNVKFGSTASFINVDKININETAHNYTSKMTGLSDISMLSDSGEAIVELSLAKSKIRSASISIGNSLSSITMMSKAFRLNGRLNQPVLTYLDSDGDGVYSTTLGSVGSDLLLSGRRLRINSKDGYDNINVISNALNLLTAQYFKDGYLVTLAGPLAEGKLDTLQIGYHVKPDGTQVYGRSIVQGALYNISQYIPTGGYIQMVSEDAVVDGLKSKIESFTTLDITSKDSTAIGSKREVSLGIDVDGVISKEILINKGMVQIPNLYIQKKANYSLSGVKHTSAYTLNPSVIWIPNKKNNTSNITGAYNCEYSTAIQHDVVLEPVSALFDTTINDLSGSLKSYIVRFSGVDGVEILAADVSSDGSELISNYALNSATTGLDSMEIPDFTSNRFIKAYSTPNAMYVFVIEKVRSNLHLVTYSSVDSNVFTKINSIGIPNIEILNSSISVVSDVKIDHIWIAIQCGITASTYYTGSRSYETYTSLVLNIVNNCGACISSIHNGELAQDTFSHPTVANVVYSKYGEYAPIKAILINGKVKAYVASQYGCGWTTSHHDRAFWETVGTLVIDGRFTSYALAVKEYETSDFGGISKKFILTSVTNGQDLSNNGSVVDLEVSPDASAFTFINAFESKTVSYTITSSGIVTNSVINGSESLTRSIVSFSEDLNYYEKKMLLGSSSAYIKIGANAYVAALSSVVSSSARILNDTAFAYFDGPTSSIKYYDSANSISSLIMIIDLATSLEDRYKLKGAVVDYIGVHDFMLNGSYSSYLLSNDDLNVFNLAQVKTIADRATYFEKYGSEIISIVDSANSKFNLRNVTDVVSLNKVGSLIQVSCGLDVEYDANYNVNKVGSESVFGTLASALHVKAGIHVEILSYISKNIGNNLDGVSFAGYSIVKKDVDVYEITCKSDSLSGYRVPYLIEDVDTAADQLSTSNYAKCALVHGYEMAYSKVNTFIVKATNSYTVACSASYAEFVSRKFNSTHVLIKIDNALLNPLNSSFNPAIAVVNEFSNVVSIKTESIAGLRIGYANNGRGSLILGLTEISEIGGNCE